MARLNILLVLTLGISLSLSCNRSLKNEAENPAPGNPQMYQNPVFEPILADPTVVRDPSTGLFYAYGTEDDWADGEGRRLITILESDNLVDWRIIGNAFEKKPDWKNGGGLWAPDIHFFKEQYYLYYSFSKWNDPNPGIGLAISDNPKGPFADVGKILDSRAMNVPNSIDPCFYSDDTGHYLFWGSFSDAPTQGTYAIKLTEDGHKIREGANKIKIAAGDFEAVMIHKRDDYYYFFGSRNSCCEGADSKYHVLVARSRHLLGPYTDREGNLISERGHGTLFLEGNEKIVGPGHNSNIVTDCNGQDWMLYHGIDINHGKIANGTTRRMLLLDKVQWKDGWPYISGNSPSLEKQAGPVF